MKLTVILVKSCFLEKEEHFCLERAFPWAFANAWDHLYITWNTLAPLPNNLSSLKWLLEKQQSQQ